MQEDKNFEILKFETVNIPKPYESPERSNDKFVQWGSDNMYPHFLLRLYNDSPIHSSIVNSKVNYIIGDGLKYSGDTDVKVQVNADDSFSEFSRKVITDYLIFNYFCVEVVYNKFNQPIEYHSIPAHKIRTNKDKSKFWYFEDIIQNSRKYIVFDRFKPDSKDSTSKIFFFDGYFPSVNNVYPIPEYNGSLKSIQNDIEIRDFNLNNIKNHFSVSSIITFFRGSNVSEEIKRKIISDLKASYTGSTGKRMIVDFQDPSQPSADVKNISPNDWDKAYDAVSRSVADDIYRGHQVTSPMLFGVKTEGQLGGATELETAYEIFKDTYIRNRRSELEKAFNYLFTDSSIITDQLSFADRQLFAARISETLKEKIYTINELRKEAGLTSISNGDRLLQESKETLPVSNNFYIGDSKTDDPFHLTEEDFEKIKGFGLLTEEFEFIEDGDFISCKEDFSRVELEFEQEDEIGKYILDKKITGIDLTDLKAGLRKDLGINISISDLKNTLKNLVKSGLIGAEISEGKVSIKPAENNEPEGKIEVMYSYDVRPGMGAAIIDKTRPFCRRLVENNRLYTREEIQRMTAIFGYDIYKYGGGFYRNPKTNELTSHCRHQFKSKKVKRKKNNY
jgi:hypothetical protein